MVIPDWLLCAGIRRQLCLSSGTKRRATKLLIRKTGYLLLFSGFLLGGNYNNNGANNVGSNGNYWSRTANSGQNGYNLNLNTSSVNPANNNNKYNGNSVRCLAQ